MWKQRRDSHHIDRPQDVRGEFERDRSRIIHSAAFRRLQAKTQILGASEGDFHRTRLTHSMEVAQISRGIVLFLRTHAPEKASLLPELELIESIGFAHDLGHPPFGHGGEIALNCIMANYGGFEGNGQTLRLLSRLEAHTPDYGLNLTRRTLLGVLKYPVAYSRICRRTQPQLPERVSQTCRLDWIPPKCYLDTEQDIVDWILEPLSEEDRQHFIEIKKPEAQKHGASIHHSLDASIMEIADDIAYGVHDLEDAIALRFITQDHWKEIAEKLDPAWAKAAHLEDIEQTLFDTSGRHQRKQAVGAMVNALIASIEFYCEDSFQEPLLAYNVRLHSAAALFLDAMKQAVLNHVILLDTVQTLGYRGHQVITALFDAFSSDPELLLPHLFKTPNSSIESVSDLVEQNSRQKSQQELKHKLCDYIAGMTDQYANRMYERLFIPQHGSVFDRL